uniref:Uncharacterized protein n=1 Tax=Opuntia streptacantha TaxID=393608 RepID=A0A7C9ARZ2_OPUST
MFQEKYHLKFAFRGQTGKSQLQVFKVTQVKSSSLKSLRWQTLKSVNRLSNQQDGKPSTARWQTLKTQNKLSSHQDRRLLSHQHFRLKSLNRFSSHQDKSLLNH